jgi:hypothetical protein
VVPDRSLVTLRLLQTSCGLLAAASLVALGRPAPGIVAHDGAATVASGHPAVPTAWSGSGPLAIPTIGVVPPGAEDWFDPTAEPTFRSGSPLASAVGLPSGPEAPGPGTQQPSPVDAEQRFPAGPPADTPPASTAAPQPSASTPTTPPAATSPTADVRTTTAPRTTASETTAARTTASPSTTTPGVAPSATPTRPAPQTNGRGNVVLAFGDELAVLDGETDAVAFAIAVDGVDADVACADPANPPPVNGSLVALLVRVTTGPDLSAVGGEPAVRAGDFRVVGPDGGAPLDAGTPSAASCVPEGDAFPVGPLTAGQERTGVVVLDVPTPTGTLVFAPDFLPVGAEWVYGPPAAE